MKIHAVTATVEKTTAVKATERREDLCSIALQLIAHKGSFYLGRRDGTLRTGVWHTAGTALETPRRPLASAHALCPSLRQLLENRI